VVSGVRKHPTLTPSIWRGGKHGGTPIITDLRPAAPKASQIAGAVIDVAFTVPSASYEWPVRLRKPYTPSEPGSWLVDMHIQAGTVIGGMTLSSRP
jgi:hypothetical protein